MREKEEEEEEEKKKRFCCGVSIFTLWKGKDEKNLPTVHSPVCSPALIALAG
jgi:hypothetical protein